MTGGASCKSNIKLIFFVNFFSSIVKYVCLFVFFYLVLSSLFHCDSWVHCVYLIFRMCIRAYILVFRTINATLLVSIDNSHTKNYWLWLQKNEERERKICCNHCSVVDEFNVGTSHHSMHFLYLIVCVYIWNAPRIIFRMCRVDKHLSAFFFSIVFFPTFVLRIMSKIYILCEALGNCLLNNKTLFSAISSGCLREPDKRIYLGHKHRSVIEVHFTVSHTIENGVCFHFQKAIFTIDKHEQWDTMRKKTKKVLSQ